MRILIIMTAALALAACKQNVELPSIISPYRIDIQQGNVVTQEMVDKLKAGMTRSQVRFVLGSPLVTDMFHSDRWDYVYLMQKQGKPEERRRLTVIFDGDKLQTLEGDIVATDRALEPAAAPKPPTATAAPSAKPAAVKPAIVAPAPALKPEAATPALKPPVAAPSQSEQKPEAKDETSPASATSAAKSETPAADGKDADSVTKDAAKTDPSGADGPKADAAKADAAKADAKKTDAAAADDKKDPPKRGIFGRMLDKIGF